MTLLLVAAGCGDENSPATTTPVADAPMIAPDFTTVTLSGDVVSFSDLKGRPVVLNFAASWCAPCELEAPVLVAAYEKYSDRVQFFGLAVKDDMEAQRAFAERHGLQFPIGGDPDSSISLKFQRAAKVPISGIPTTYFINEEGIIVDYFIGPLSDISMEKKIATILPAADSGQSAPAPPAASPDPAGPAD